MRSSAVMYPIPGCGLDAVAFAADLSEGTRTGAKSFPHAPRQPALRAPQSRTPQVAPVAHRRTASAGEPEGSACGTPRHAFAAPRSSPRRNASSGATPLRKSPPRRPRRSSGASRTAIAAKADTEYLSGKPFEDKAEGPHRRAVHRREPGAAPEDYPHRSKWEAQVATLLPIVGCERRRYLKTHRSHWRFPHARKDGWAIENADQLEIGDMVRTAYETRALAGEAPRLNRLRRMRNALAHNEIVPWSTLVSRDAKSVVDLGE